MKLIKAMDLDFIVFVNSVRYGGILSISAIVAMFITPNALILAEAATKISDPSQFITGPYY